MKFTILLLVLSSFALFAQDGNPDVLVGIGPTWMRGAANPYDLDLNVALRLGQSNFYSYWTVSTPIITVPKTSQPAVSSVTTGGAYIAKQSKSKAVSLIFLGQGGVTANQVTGTIAPTFTGSFGVSFRIGKLPLFVMPFAKAASAPTPTNSSGFATVVFQPGVQLFYGFGGQ